MHNYYIVFEKHCNITTKSYVIRETPNNMDTVEGLIAEIDDLEKEFTCDIWLINWKHLKC